MEHTKKYTKAIGDALNARHYKPVVQALELQLELPGKFCMSYQL